MNGLSAIIRGRPDARRPDPLRFALLALTAILVLFAAWEAILVVPEALSGPALGLDFHLYLERARSWLAGNGFYLERQLTGAPYEVGTGDALYPPSVLYLLVPATVLPAFIWWLIPAMLTGYALWRHRPQLWGWTYITLAFCWPRTWQAILFGNPVIWVVAAVAAGTLWGWPYVGAFLKPTFGLFGLLGARSRSWWVALGSPSSRHCRWQHVGRLRIGPDQCPCRRDGARLPVGRAAAGRDPARRATGAKQAGR